MYREYPRIIGSNASEIALVDNACPNPKTHVDESEVSSNRWLSIVDLPTSRRKENLCLSIKLQCYSDLESALYTSHDELYFFR